MLENVKLPGEIFKDMDSYEGYAVSNKGRVYSYKTSKILTQQTANSFSYGHEGEKYVLIQKDKKRTIVYVHIAVAIAFVPNTGRRKNVNHIDGDITNNNADNLEWVGRPKKYTEDWIYYRLGLKKFKREIKNRSQSKRVVCTNYNIEFESIARAAEIVDVSSTTMKKACDTGIDIHGLYFKLA